MGFTVCMYLVLCIWWALLFVCIWYRAFGELYCLYVFGIVQLVGFTVCMYLVLCIWWALLFVCIWYCAFGGLYFLYVFGTVQLVGFTVCMYFVLCIWWALLFVCIWYCAFGGLINQYVTMNVWNVWEAGNFWTILPTVMFTKSTLPWRYLNTRLTCQRQCWYLYTAKHNEHQ